MQCNFAACQITLDLTSNTMADKIVVQSYASEGKLLKALKNKTDGGNPQWPRYFEISSATASRSFRWDSGRFL